MKEKFAIAHTPYETGPIGPEDAEAVCAFYNGLSEPSFFFGYLDGRDHSDPKTWIEILELAKKQGQAIFALWNKDKIIGITNISYKEENGERVAIFSGAKMADAHLGQHLSKHLYDVRKQHLRDIGFEGRVEAYIRPSNKPSHRAARGNGFTDTERTLPEHPDHHIYELRI